MPRPRDDRRLLHLPDDEFLAAISAKGLGGTDIGAVLGLSRYKNATDVWREKMGVAAPVPDNNNMRRGRALEPIAIAEYEADTGRETYPVDQLRHPDEAWAIGSPDAIISAYAHMDGPGVLEVKCLRQQGYRRTIEEGIDTGYYVQLQHYLYCSGLTWGAFAVFNAEDWTLHAFDVARDEEMVARLAEAGRAFWHDHVLTRTPPDAYLPDAVPRALVEGHGRTAVDVSGDAQWTTALERLRRAREAFTIAEDQKKRAEEIVKDGMDASGYTTITDGTVRVTFNREQTRRTLDRDALLAAHPEIEVERFMRASVVPTMRVTLTSGGGR